MPAPKGDKSSTGSPPPKWWQRYGPPKSCWPYQVRRSSCAPTTGSTGDVVLQHTGGPNGALDKLVQRMELRPTQMVITATPQGNLLGVVLREDAQSLLDGQSPVHRTRSDWTADREERAWCSCRYPTTRPAISGRSRDGQRTARSMWCCGCCGASLWRTCPGRWGWKRIALRRGGTTFWSRASRV